MRDLTNTPMHYRFNPRTREGAFNPRTREGATMRDLTNTPMHYRFNPRTREGATIVPLLTLGSPIVSIHAPVRVRHDGLSNRRFLCNVSIHAPVRVRPVP